MTIKEEAVRMKKSAPVLAASSIEQRNRALNLIAIALEKHKEEIFEANTRDMRFAEKNDVAEATKKRLLYNEKKLADSIGGVLELKLLDDPIGHVLMNRQLDEALLLRKISVPIGVIGVIFEARPDAMVQVASLCIKSGNCAILKGGKETTHTNRVLFDIIKEAVIEADLPADCLMQAQLHNEIDELLKCDGEVDLLIPRGSNRFVQHIMDNTKIPVMGHSSGICHIYVDKDLDPELALSVIVDAKKNYPAACNAVETLLIHRDIAEWFLPAIAQVCMGEKIKMNGTQEVKAIVGEEIGILDEDEFGKEYNDMELSIKIVGDIKEAIEHINYFGSHHTDCILTKDDETAKFFVQMVDSAGVYRNCSTRFADGYRYGFGAEVGISTGKLHARGPVGLDGLVTYKYILTGNGHIVEDYSNGKKQFTHKDL